MKYRQLFGLALSLTIMHGAAAKELRIGIIGLDTSHSVAFTRLLNDPKDPQYVSGGKVVAAYKGGSPDIPASANRIEEYTRKLQQDYDVKIVDSIPALCKEVDVVLIESIDGRPHLEQVKPVLAARKPVYIDKPMAASLRDVAEIFRLAKEANVPLFSSSSLRFARDTQNAHKGVLGKIQYAETYGPCEIEPHHPDLFWYGIHGVEALFTVMGTGCESVQRGTNAQGKIEVIGLWPGGRKGIYREDKNFRGTAKGQRGEATVGSFDGYAPLVIQIMKFFRTGQSPVSSAETIEIFAFMEAADESKRQGGAPVKIKDVLRKHGVKN